MKESESAKNKEEEGNRRRWCVPESALFDLHAAERTADAGGGGIVPGDERQRRRRERGPRATAQTGRALACSFA